MQIMFWFLRFTVCEHRNVSLQDEESGLPRVRRMTLGRHNIFNVKITTTRTDDESTALTGQAKKKLVPVAAATTERMAAVAT